MAGLCRSEPPGNKINSKANDCVVPPHRGSTSAAVAFQLETPKSKDRDQHGKMR
ncbi:hypothetical protein RBSH_05829 [Rhodopirellula baltica SH28]|uniref:Uncharacterized protein n=1 Tax=Rhodopirellula baltica SH28 TaxID=993517 RepID=K5D8L2_RHOBT|nr:hypothetical protein RBSH_05829 [Rhodopirellula baltica SH28]